MSVFKLPACGIYFPNNLLNGGDDAVLAAPVANFERELQRMHLATNSFSAVITTNSCASQSADSELADLRTALAGMNMPVSRAGIIIKEHQLERAKLQAYVETIESSAPLVWDGTNYVRDSIQPLQSSAPSQPPAESLSAQPPPPPSPPLSQPPFPDVQVTPGLPIEFVDYFAGAIAWENPALQDKSEAREAWERLLALPATQRHFKSTWAAFMLGKFWMSQNPEKAVAYFQQTRELARQGFVDSCGLAAASYGMEALICLQQTNFQHAIDLYLQQLETGDDSAINSLRFTASRALVTHDASILESLAANAKAQRVITAYLISYTPYLSKDEQAKGWLIAVEGAGVTDVDSAEELALAAYQAGEWDIAQRWINRAPGTPVAQWLQAKLLLRAGKVKQAGAKLSKVVRLFPPESGTNAPAGLKDDLNVVHEESGSFVDPSSQVLGELAVLHLVRRDYVEALDASLRSGFWMDAAYVAERVLTVDELKKYVDRNWPATSSTNLDETDETNSCVEIRYLLARRLGRLHRYDEAHAYYPPQWQQPFDTLVQNLKDGRDATLPANQRAKALFAAAVITRTNGIELLGTELEPDWFIYEGVYDEGVSIASRTNENAKLIGPSVDEVKRYGQHDADPERRYHYRYLAADLAFEAAQLMPDNSGETALVLCKAGSWIKYLDPPRANPIYQTLVQRCGKTQIGRQADLMHWFPVLDDSDKPIPYRPRVREKWELFHDRLGAAMDPGYFYYCGTIHMMDEQNGWAQSAATLLETNDWVFEQNAILRTTNGGMSWKVVLCASPDSNLTPYFCDKDTAWATAVCDESSNVILLKTMDGGQSWGDTELSQPHAIQDCELSFPSANQGWLLFMPDHAMNSMPGYLYHSDEYGEEWRRINSTENSGNNWNDPEGLQDGFADNHPYLICGGTIKFQDFEDGWLLGQLTTTTRPFLFFTQDAGETWQEKQIPPVPSLRDGEVVPDKLPCFFGNDGILATRFVPNDHEATNFDTVIYDSHDAGKNWEATTPIKFSGVWDFISGQTGWMWSPEPHGFTSKKSVKGILYQTNDGGHSWKPVKAEKSLEEFLTHGETIVQLDFVDENTGWAIAEDWRKATQVLQTIDGGKTWNALAATIER